MPSAENDAACTYPACMRVGEGCLPACVRDTAENDVACPAVLNIAGEHFTCDWGPTDEHGHHKGWAHTNAAASAIWTSDPAYDGLPDTRVIPPDRG